MPPPLDLLDDTWEMTPDLRWAQKFPTTKPSKRRGHALAYDAARKQTILFGGDADAAQTTGDRLGDTWAWDGTTWSMLSPPTSPPARSHAAMAYDPDRNVLVLFGGRTGTSGYLDDTWEWDGATWTFKADSHSTSLPTPRARADASMVYDPLRHRIVLLGGGAVAQDGSHFGDVWEWDGTSWAETIDDPRLARVAAHAFFDRLHGGIVVYGGEVSTSQGNTDQTWLLRWESLAKRETCEFPDDDLDGDGARGCQDPDCAPRCQTCGDGTCDVYEDRLICDADCN
jgi:hypothetical protein